MIYRVHSERTLPDTADAIVDLDNAFTAVCGSAWRSLSVHVCQITRQPETILKLPSFRGAYAKRRCIVPVNNFFEWRKSKPPKVPYAVGMKDGSPEFGSARIWESWTHPVTGELIRTFCILTCPANDVIAAIHDRMPVILPLDAYDRGLSPIEPDPYDLLVTYPSDLMRMWPISNKVNSPRNDTPDILDPDND